MELRCVTCNCYLPTSSLQQHLSGRRHLGNVASKGLSKPGNPQPVSPSQSSSSNLLSTPPENTSTRSRANAPEPNVVPPVTMSVESRSSSKVPYCATTLQGDPCANSRCQYLHDVVHCEPCGRSYPASLFSQHQSGKLHQEKAASKGPTDQYTTQTSCPSQPTTPNPEPTPPSRSSPLVSGGSPSTPAADLPITMSHEDGLDFVAEGTRSAADRSFPSINISIENTSSLHNISVKSMKLEPSPSPCFSASLLGKSVVIEQGAPRKIRVDFKAPQAGSFHAILKVTFSDKARPNDQGWVVTRELRGRVILPASGSPIIDKGTTAKDIAGGDDTGITIFPHLALEFSVECPRSNELYATQTKDLIITKTSPSPSVSFMTATVYSPDASMTDSFSARLEGDSMMIEPKEMRVVSVSFTPRQGGLFEAVLELTFHDHKRNADFVVKRTLTGWAERPTVRQGHHPNKSTLNPGVRPIKDDANDNGVHSVDEGEYLDSDGTGITVSHDDGLDFGIVERKRPNGPFSTPSSLFTIKLAASYSSVTFVKEKTRTLDGSDPEFVAVFEGDSLNIRPGTESTVRVIFSPKFEGMFKATLELVFYHSLLSTCFAVRRMLQGIAGSLSDHKQIESLGQGDESDDEPTQTSQEVPPQKTIVLFPPDQRPNSRCLPDYDVPAIIQEAVNNSTATSPYDKKAPELVSVLRPDRLAMTSTYVHYFEALLCVEDGHQQWDVLCQPPYPVNRQWWGQQFDVEIEKDDEDLLPEVAIGDSVWLDDQKNLRFEARVTDTDVHMRQHLAVMKVSLRLPTDLNHYYTGPNAQFVVQVRHNRIALHRQYHALTKSFPPTRRLLFPSVLDIKPNRHLSKTEIYNLNYCHLVNRCIRDDPQQLQAVVSILEQPKGSIPFIIYGPPGTGKTLTVVESVVQLVRRDAGVRVLACTPSNAAANYLFERLAAVGMDSDKLYRFTAPFFQEEDASEDLQTSSSHERLLSFRVVVSTCSEAGILQDLDVPVGHFSHIVIDEAAQAEEPLVMIPIVTFSNASTNIILAGDPHQLGPMIKSPTAARSGLGKSYFERLMHMRDIYGTGDTQVGKPIVVLRRNRRSHGAIIAWSNRYLYEDMMRDCGNSNITCNLVHSDVLPKKGFPVMFHGVKNSEQGTKSSPSSFNVLEASIIRNYCVRLIGDSERKIYPGDIGVLASYKTQIRAIRRLLKVAKLSDVSVGSVDQFQGQERKVMILAASRSNEESHPRKSLGVLVSRQRMNVALTRAQALLIVIGDPEVLGKYGHWRSFLRYVKSRKGWTGKMHDWEPEEVIPPPRYEIIPRNGGIVYGEEFIGGKSEKGYRISGSSEVIG